MAYTCPECGTEWDRDPGDDWDTCPSCGAEVGND